MDPVSKSTWNCFASFQAANAVAEDQSLITIIVAGGRWMVTTFFTLGNQCKKNTPPNLWGSRGFREQIVHFCLLNSGSEGTEGCCGGSRRMSEEKYDLVYSPVSVSDGQYKPYSFGQTVKRVEFDESSSAYDTGAYFNDKGEAVNSQVGEKKTIFEVMQSIKASSGDTGQGDDIKQDLVQFTIDSVTLSTFVAENSQSLLVSFNELIQKANDQFGLNLKAKKLEAEILASISEMIEKHSIPQDYSFIKAFNQVRKRPESPQKHADLYKLSQAYTRDVQRYGQTIITEIALPKIHKTIPTVHIGGVAGGRKYIMR
jgi:hypothetical protein